MRAGAEVGAVDLLSRVTTADLVRSGLRPRRSPYPGPSPSPITLALALALALAP